MQYGHFLWSYFTENLPWSRKWSRRESRETKASLKCAPERWQSPVFVVLSRTVSINPILSLCYSLLPTTKTAHYAKEFVQLSRSKSLSRVASYCLWVPLHSGHNGRNISCSSRNVKAKSFKLMQVSQAFPFRVSDLCRIPFKSCKTPLVNWNRMPRLPFRLYDDSHLVFLFAWNLFLNKAYILPRMSGFAISHPRSKNIALNQKPDANFSSSSLSRAE